MFLVIQVKLESFVVAIPQQDMPATFDLVPAGDPGLSRKPHRIARIASDSFLLLLARSWAIADYGHVTPNNVTELRDLVEVSGSKPSPHSGYPLIAIAREKRFFVGADFHRPK